MLLEGSGGFQQLQTLVKKSQLIILKLLVVSVEYISKYRLRTTMWFFFLTKFDSTLSSTIVALRRGLFTAPREFLGT